MLLPNKFMTTLPPHILALPTPRTDANEKLFFSSINGIPDPSRNYVPVDFARQLEREQLYMMETLDKQGQVLFKVLTMMDNANFTPDSPVLYDPREVREALTAYNKLKQDMEEKK